jgi:hypothetical protein
MHILKYAAILVPQKQPFILEIGHATDKIQFSSENNKKQGFTY